MRIRTIVISDMLFLVMIMGIKNEVVKRFMQICENRGINPNQLATISGIPPSTVYSMLDETRQDISMVTVKKLCDGLEMKLPDFFNTTEFWELEQEIQ